MKKVLKTLVIIIIVVIGLFFIIPLFMDTQYNLKRTVVVDADKETVKNYMGNFENFQDWSPWAEMDEEMEIEISGEAGTVGSSYEWEGNEDVGEGVMTITEVTNDTVKIKLKFEEPFESESPTYYAFKDVDGKTEVTWYMEGEMSYPWNIMGLFVNMEEAIGKDFEKGLGKLKSKVESLPKEEETAEVQINIETVEVPTRTFIGKRDVVMFENMQKFYADNLGAAYTAITENNLAFDGSPSGIYFVWEPEKGQADMAAVIPVKDLKNDLDGFETFELGGKALKTVHIGSYDDLDKPHNAMEAYVNANDIVLEGPALEEYITDPGNEPDTSKWVTHIYYFFK
jgi:effector-binding domain-containing protein